MSLQFVVMLMRKHVQKSCILSTYLLLFAELLTFANQNNSSCWTYVFYCITYIQGESITTSQTLQAYSVFHMKEIVWGDYRANPLIGCLKKNLHEKFCNQRNIANFLTATATEAQIGFLHRQ